ncbi:hypothetical protein PR202_gb27697 [Eleusine coracana subsp. coracana]|uniref:Solute carrier family 40 member n=1 Tax=Eleusine coracana subsp. coracana TaxID=191504 RepID=A0AAV5FVG6_ELECO|nr:hypothetical protein PR202_gb27697 [Eleusine coracana subsp. coracana]
MGGVDLKRTPVRLVRRIDLTCSLLASLSSPASSSASRRRKCPQRGAGVWNVASVGMEYNGVPSTAGREQLIRQRRAGMMMPLEIVAQTGPLDWRARLTKQLLGRIPCCCWDSWVVYARQDVALPGVALALLYTSPS